MNMDKKSNKEKREAKRKKSKAVLGGKELWGREGERENYALGFTVFEMFHMLISKVGSRNKSRFQMSHCLTAMFAQDTLKHSENVNNFLIFLISCFHLISETSSGV